MNAPRRAHGFAPIAAYGLDALGLSRTRARDLALQVAWRRVAGPALAQRAVAVAVRRGVLELAVADPAWRRAVERLLPELGAKLQRRHPELGVTRFRLVDAPSA
jgi:hypothetical protein